MSAISDILGGSSDSSGPTPTQYNTWQPSNLGGQDSNFNTAINNNFAASGNTAPSWSTYLNNTTNNPYAAGAQTSANTAGQAYTNTGYQALGASQNLAGGASTVLNNAFDPQSSIYNTSLQNNTDTTNAALAARGLNTSAQGADLANQSNINFNQAWDNNQLARQQAGLAAAGSGYANAGQQGTSGAESINAGGANPLNAYQTNNSNLGAGLSNYQTGSTAADNAAIPAILQYLSLGANQSNQQGNFDQQYFNNLETQTQNQNDLNNMMFGGIGQLLGGAAGFLGSGGGSSGGIFGTASSGNVDWATPNSLNATTTGDLYSSLPDVASSAGSSGLLSLLGLV